jgi:hypothetical protein
MKNDFWDYLDRFSGRKSTRYRPVQRLAPSPLSRYRLPAGLRLPGKDGIDDWSDACGTRHSPLSS